MATKPNETYRWGENATREQVAAYADTGWPSDIIPPKRTQFNWYQNLVGEWLGWIEETVDDIVETVLDRFFVLIDAGTVNDDLEPLQLVPNEFGIYRLRYDVIGGTGETERLVVVDGVDTASVTAITGGVYQVYRINRSGNQWMDDGVNFNRSTSVSDITARNDTRYATPELLYQTGGQVTTGSNAYGGGWSEVTAGPDWIVLSEWGGVTVDSTGNLLVPTRAASEYSVQHSAVATPVGAENAASCVSSIAGIDLGLRTLSDGSPTGGTVYYNYTVRIPRP